MNPGGAQRVLLHLLKAMDPERFACDVVALHGPGPVSEEFEQAGIPPLHLAHTKWDPRIPLRLRRLIRSNRYAVVHAHLVPSCFVCETLRGWLGIPRLVVHAHNLYCRHEPLRYQNVLEKGLYRRADAVVASSETTLASLPARPGLRRVIYNGLSQAVLDQLAHLPTQQAARRQLALPEDASIVGAIGRVSAAKNQVLLCHAAAALRDAAPTLHVVIVGDGPEAATIKATAHSLGVGARVCTAGYQPDPLPWLASMDVFAMPSSGEGFGMALIEAMAAGKPCIVPSLPWAREITRHNRTALHFAPDNTDELAAQIRRLIDEPETARRLGEAAQESVRSRFTAQTMAKQVGDLYQRLLEGVNA
jgi:glycosyltransferase involved in cell wall biosynthesis